MKYLLILIISVIIAGGILISSKSGDEATTPMTEKSDINPSQSTEIAGKALFVIYTNGAMRTFSDPRYHNKSEEIYITSEFPYVIHVEKPGLKWKDFFSTLPMKLEKACLTTGTKQVFCSNNNSTLKFYINSIRDDNALDKIIKRKDRLLVSYGPSEDPDIQSQLEVLDNY